MGPYGEDADDELLAELGDAVRSGAAVPATFVAAGKGAFTWRNIDAELAELRHDSVAEPLLAGTRAEPGTLRSLTFVTSRLAIELELTEEALLGQVVPPQPGRIELQRRDAKEPRPEPLAVEVDELGWFAFRPAPRGLCRMRLHTGDGGTVLTEWTRL